MIKDKAIGYEKLYRPIGLVGLSLFILISSFVLVKLELFGSIVLTVVPLALFFLYCLFKEPILGLWSSLLLGFISMGLGRYMSGPIGLSVDIVLFLTVLAVLFKKFQQTDFAPVRNDLMLLVLVWMVYQLLELFNPEARSFEAWFYAVRGVGLYQLFAVFAALMLWKKARSLDVFLQMVFWISVAGMIWGMRQMLFGVDAAEQQWLNEGNASTHILFGKLRVFSFYSDAGQFGASQGHVGLIGLIIALGSAMPWKQRIAYGLAGLACLWGMMVSGTRGALAVPGLGFLVFLIMSKNFRLLLTGLFFVALVFYILKFTFLFQGVEQVARMRTALDPENPSFQTRLRNQQKLADYLEYRPFGGGIGTAGFWGLRFSPGTFLAETPTDSWYVRIWAEEGVVGIMLHIGILMFIMGRAGYHVWHLNDPVLKQKGIALYAGMAGILLASYGNGVFGQMPTGIIMYFTMVALFKMPEWDTPMKEPKE
jgi:hypothetical protein